MKRLFASLLCVLALCALLTACGQEAQPRQTIAYHKADFVLNGMVYTQQQVEDGNAAIPVKVEIPGLRFAGWTDQDGKPVEPENKHLLQDMTYIAVVYPELSRHTYFLFPDGRGLLRPDDFLTGDELAMALNALAADGAAAYFPALPQGAEPVASAQLKAVLARFFQEDTVESALSQAQEQVSRGEFAVAMCQLLGRDGQETVVLAEDTKVPADLNIHTDHYQALLEASVEHTVSPDGIPWSDVELPTGMEPGFTNLDGYLYYVQENGYFLRNGNVGKLHFGEDGRYTCGDAELDDTVAEILAPIVEMNPNADRLKLLREAFDYCVNNYKYLRRSPYEMGATGWEIEDAKQMYEKKMGNCYSFAGLFWALAQGLGYEATPVSGTCTATNQPHAWVVIRLDGEEYFFDTQWQNAYLEREDRQDKEKYNMFMIPVKNTEGRLPLSFWNYQWKEGSF